MKPDHSLPIAGFIVAPPAGAIAWFILNGATASELYSGIMIWSFVVSWVLSIVLGIPTYIFLRNRNKLSVSSLVAGGAFIAALPWLVLTFLPGTTYKKAGEIVIVQNGSYTPDGMLFEAKFIANLGLCGAIAGFIFWVIIKSLITSHSSTPAKPAGRTR